MTTTKAPVRIQRKRTKGWKMPANTKCVNRPLKYGNPLRIGDTTNNGMHLLTIEEILSLFRNYALSTFGLQQIQRDLRGWNLACFCPLDQPCHADVLLELANQ